MIRRCASLTVSASRQGEADFKERFRAQIDAEKADTDPHASFRCAHRKINNFSLSMQSPQARFSPDGQTIYCVFDAVSARRADTLDETYSNMDGIGDTIVDMLDLTPDGKRLLFHKMRSSHQPRERGARPIVVNLGEDCKLWVADAATGDILRGFSCHEKELTALCALPDNAHCVTAGHDFAVYQWDLTTGERALAYETDAEYRRHSPVQKLIVSRDGRLLCGVYSPYMMLWDAASGRLLRTAKADFRLRDACFSPDGKRIYTCGDAGFGVWDAETLTQGETAALTVTVPAKVVKVTVGGETLTQFTLLEDGRKQFACTVTPENAGAYQYTVTLEEVHGYSFDAGLTPVLTVNPAPTAPAEEDDTAGSGNTGTSRGFNDLLQAILNFFRKIIAFFRGQLG